MEYLIIFTIILIFIIPIAFFIYYCLQPLSISQVKKLASKRRINDINIYYKFSHNEIDPDYFFKKQMKPSGKFYEIQETLFNFPIWVASNLKYKKHEWIILGFEKNKFIDWVWINKGNDSVSCFCLLSLGEIIDTCIQHEYKSVLMFHNHPNSDPSYYSCTKASDTDLKTAREWGDSFNKNYINFLDFVCERGKHYIFYKSINDKFLSINEYIKNINTINGISKLKNFILHMELIFRILKQIESKSINLVRIF